MHVPIAIGLSLLQTHKALAQAASSASSYVVPAEFPSSLFSSYYIDASPTQEPQPAIRDPVLDFVYPLNLTDPATIPQNDTDPAILPPAVSPAPDPGAAYQSAINQIQSIAASNGSNCTKCVDSMQVLQNLSYTAPELVANGLVNTCETLQWESNSSCQGDFDLYTFGSIWTQVLRFADIQGLDGRYICHYAAGYCPTPVQDPPLDTNTLFPKPKPANVTAPKASGERVKVLHMSDIHLDPRFDVGREANCSSYQCCRPNVHASGTNETELPAPLYGAYKCDSPYFLVTGALQAAHPLTGTVNKGNCSDTKDDTLGWTIYTGDLVSHDNQNQLSRQYTEYTETSIYSMLSQLIGGPIFATLGNHDSNPEAIDAPHSLPGDLGNQLSWNYDHVAGLWENDGFIPADAAAQARVHYGGYSVLNQYGLRIIALNTDFWYTGNTFNFYNATNPDNSGTLQWLIDELQSAEDNGERVWILGHVLTGWDGSNPLPNPTNLFYTIVERYSPHVIANAFWGHTHEDQQMIYYANNGTNRNNSRGLQDALTPGWICPSVTPLTNLNSGFRMYEVDTGSFDIMDAYTYYSPVSSFEDLEVTETGPTYHYEYSTRDAYGAAADWPNDAPLNATFWHQVSVGLENQARAGNLTLTELFNTYQGKSSIKSPACDTLDCALAKVCYLRSGSNPLGRECPQGYGSVQSAFDPPSS
ncbi:MAG: hypothetical protein Q9162_001912 [Coniocarpon cinnabarinum]